VIKKKNLSEEDKNIWENYTKNPSDVYDKDLNNFETPKKKERFKFDLHGLTLKDANDKVRQLIIFCSEKKYKEILLITGKGLHSSTDKNVFVSKNLSKLKYSVPEFIKSDGELTKYIDTISSADKFDGGEGAMLIKLKNL